MNYIKKFLKKILKDKISFHIGYAKMLASKKSDTYTKFELLKMILKSKTFRRYPKLCKKIKLKNLTTNDNFYYHIDIYKTLFSENKNIENLTIDYQKIIDNSLLDFRQKIELNKKNKKFYTIEINLLNSLNKLIIMKIL